MIWNKCKEGCNVASNKAVHIDKTVFCYFHGYLWLKEKYDAAVKIAAKAQKTPLRPT